jgi:hypothetical protein
VSPLWYLLAVPVIVGGLVLIGELYDQQATAVDEEDA